MLVPEGVIDILEAIEVHREKSQSAFSMFRSQESLL